MIALSAHAAAAKPKQSEDNKEKVELRYRPTLGLRIAYEQSLDMQMRVNTSDNGNRHVEQSQKTHSQLVVNSEEVLEMRDAIASVKRVIFGKDCWSTTQTNDKPERKSRSVYADKTVTFKLNRDDTVDQDFGVKPGKQEARFLREVMLGRSSGYPDHPVAVGDRWKSDESMRVLMDLDKEDVVSTVYSLKSIKTVAGRRVAEVHVSAGVIKSSKEGSNQELSLEGVRFIDLETGVTLKSDVNGAGSISGRPASNVTFSGKITLELHHTGRLLPAEDATAATE